MCRPFAAASINESKEDGFKQVVDDSWGVRRHEQHFTHYIQSFDSLLI